MPTSFHMGYHTHFPSPTDILEDRSFPHYPVDALSPTLQGLVDLDISFFWMHFIQGVKFYALLGHNKG